MGKTEDRSGRPGENSPDGPPEVLWNEEHAVRIHAQAAHVNFTREEVGLRFGDGRRDDSGELVFESRAQVLLSPVLAKRLALRLHHHMREYQHLHGPLHPKPRSQPDRASPDLIGKAPSRLKLDDLPEAARSLAQQVRNLGAVYGLERSFKFLPGVFLTRRLLLGFRRDTLPPDKTSRIVDICQGAGMPDDHLAAFQEHLAEATIVLLGFEQEGEQSTFRAYLEFGHRFRNGSSQASRLLEPFTIHMGYKWDPEDPTRKATTRYTCFPGLSSEAMLERIRAVYGNRDSTDPLAIAEALLECARGKSPEGVLLYFEAGEEDHPRISFDLNLYAANLQMNEMLPFLSDICTLYGIPFQDVYAWYEPVQGAVFGHLTGGLDRNGRDFMTVYFGEKGSTLKP